VIDSRIRVRVRVAYGKYSFFFISFFISCASVCCERKRQNRICMSHWDFLKRDSCIELLPADPTMIYITRYY